MKLRATLAVMLLAVQSAICRPAEVIIIRHGEKPDEPKAQHLSRRGEDRAKALVAFFMKNSLVTEHGLPVALFASEPTHKGSGQRPRETLQPLASELHLPIQTPFESKDYAKLAELILKNSKYDSKTIVICWVHEHIPSLAAALGVIPEPPKWKEQVYDEAYVITYPDGKAHLKIVPEKALPGDSKHKE
jgi:hypothetical protein